MLALGWVRARCPRCGEVVVKLEELGLRDVEELIYE